MHVLVGVHDSRRLVGCEADAAQWRGLLVDRTTGGGAGTRVRGADRFWVGGERAKTLGRLVDQQGHPVGTLGNRGDRRLRPGAGAVHRQQLDQGLSGAGERGFHRGENPAAGRVEPLEIHVVIALPRPGRDRRGRAPGVSAGSVRADAPVETVARGGRRGVLLAPHHPHLPRPEGDQRGGVVRRHLPAREGKWGPPGRPVRSGVVEVDPVPLLPGGPETALGVLVDDQCLGLVVVDLRGAQQGVRVRAGVVAVPAQGAREAGRGRHAVRHEVVARDAQRGPVPEHVVVGVRPWLGGHPGVDPFHRRGLEPKDAELRRADVPQVAPPVAVVEPQHALGAFGPRGRSRARVRGPHETHVTGDAVRRGRDR